MTHCCVWRDSFLSAILLIHLLFVTHVARFLMTCDLWKNKETYLYTMHGYGIQTELCTHECMGDTSYEKYWWVIDRVFVSHLTCDVRPKKRNISICWMYVYTQTYMRDTSYEKYWWVIDRVSVSHLTCDVWQKKWNISICQMHVYTQKHMCDTSYEK